MKIAIFYSYNGAKFSGSQTQPNADAVEDRLNSALRSVGIFERVISSSRTDKGVHALMQVSSVVCGDFWRGDLGRLKNQLNRHLGPYIRVFKLIQADFHPRYDAKSREYAYVLCFDEPSAFLSDFVHFCDEPDFILLNKVLTKFVGKHDFSAFRKVGSDEKTTIRTIHKARAFKMRKFGLNLGIISFKADGFLRSQVRLMVANAIKAAQNETRAELFASEFERIYTRIPAPPNGLYLRKIYY